MVSVVCAVKLSGVTHLMTGNITRTSVAFNWTAWIPAPDEMSILYRIRASSQQHNETVSLVSVNKIASLGLGAPLLRPSCDLG